MAQVDHADLEKYASLLKAADHAARLDWLYCIDVYSQIVHQRNDEIGASGLSTVQAPNVEACRLALIHAREVFAAIRSAVKELATQGGISEQSDLAALLNDPDMYLS